MSPSDGGLSLGGIFKEIIESNLKLKINKYGLNPFIGPSFKRKEIKSLVADFNLVYSYKENNEKLIADDIIEGKIVGLFQGRAEFGPRSLGARSILADPRNIESKSRVNQLLKKRDWFMPFAPAILEEKYKEWFGLQKPSYYMQVALDIKLKLKKYIPSAVHINNTCRTQLVSKSTNPIFWHIINNFYKKTKIPILLNTSFNRHGISTISSPRQAIEHLLNGSMDVLYIQGYRISLYENRNNFKNLKNVIKSEKILLKEQSKKWFKQSKKFMNRESIKNYKSNYLKKHNERIN